MISIDILISTPHESPKQRTFPTSVTYEVIGGQPQIINWLQGGFKMDIFHDSFPNDVPVNITVSVVDWFDPLLRDFRSATQVYKIESTLEPSGNVTIHLKHNLIVSSDTNKSQIFLFHYKRLDTRPNMIPIDAISADTISTKIDSFSYYEVGVNQSKGTLGVYGVTLFYKESGYDIIEVIAVIQKHGQELSDKYSNITKDLKSPFKMTHNVTSSMILEPSGCWAKYENKDYNRTITDPNDELYFTFQWDCWLWPKKTMISVQLNDKKFDIFANPNIVHPVVYYSVNTFLLLLIVLCFIILLFYFAASKNYNKLFGVFLGLFFIFGWYLLGRIWGIDYLDTFISTWWNKIATVV